MAVDFASLETKIDEAVAALEGGDLDTAETKAISASLILSGLPDSKQGPTDIRWRPILDSLLGRINRLKSAKQGVHRSKVKYEPATGCS